jgi:hypothetical protein
MRTSKHIHILRLAAKGELPERIGEDSSIDIGVVRELHEAGLIKAIDTSSLSGRGYKKPRITVEGRARLKEVRWRRLKWLAGIAVAVATVLIIAAVERWGFSPSSPLGWKRRPVTLLRTVSPFGALYFPLMSHQLLSTIP